MVSRWSERPGATRWIALALIASVAACGGGQSGSQSAMPSAPAAQTTSGATTSPAGGAAAATSPVDAGAPVGTPVDAPTVIDVPSTVALDSSVTTDGGALAGGGATLYVPAGAVSGATKVAITRLDAPFFQNPYARHAADAVKAVSIGPALDFGPAGLTFAKPVTVSVPYDPAAVPDGYSTLAVAYWTGSRWSVIGGTVDTKSHTVSVAQTAFGGEILTTIAVATAVGLVIHAGIKWWYGKEGVKVDPISEKKAAGWIQPADATVATAAKGATVGGVPITDKQALTAWLDKHPSAGQNLISVTGPDGVARTQVYSSGANTNWQQPGDYLGKNGLKGDCTDVTNAMVSVFRAAGYPAKAVFGYAGDKDSPHAWGEVAIGGKVYAIDEEGRLQPLADAVAAMHLIRPDAGDPRGFMWDEQGQTPYQADWWSLDQLNGHWTGTFTVTDLTMDDAVLKTAADQGCTAAILDAMKGKALPLTMDIKLDKTGKGTATILIDTASIKGKDGKSLGTPKPQALNATFDGTALKFHLDAGSGSTASMSGTVTGGTSIAGSMKTAGKGYSMTAAWTVSR